MGKNIKYEEQNEEKNYIKHKQIEILSNRKSKMFMVF